MAQGRTGVAQCSALASHNSGGSRVYVVRGPGNHVHEIAWVGTDWNTTDLTATARDSNGNTPPPAIAGSALTSHDSDGSRMYFISSDNHVHELRRWGPAGTPPT